MCMSVWLTCMSVHSVRACCLQRPKEGVGSHETGITDGLEEHRCSKPLSHFSSPTHTDCDIQPPALYLHTL